MHQETKEAPSERIRPASNSSTRSLERSFCAIAALALFVVAVNWSAPAQAQHAMGAMGGVHMGGGFGAMQSLHPAMSLGGMGAMHPYGYGLSPAGMAPMHPLAPYSPTPLAPHAMGYNGWNPWGPANAAHNHPLYPPNHPLTPLYPPNHPLTPIQPVHPWYPNNYVWPWWWYSNPYYGYTYNMAPYPYPYSNFWEMLGFYGHYGYYGPQQGMVVTGVNTNTLANQIGLVQGDIVTAVNGTPVKNAEQFVEALREAQGTVALTVYDTRNGRTSQLSFDPKDAARYAPPNVGSQPSATGANDTSVTDESLGTQEDVRKVEDDNN